jgi:hypothetical protein
VRRLGDIALTAAITAVVTTLVNNAIADTSGVGRTWQHARAGFLVFADRAEPIFAVGAGVLLSLWLGLGLLLVLRQQRTDALEVDPRLPNPMTVLACAAILMLAAAFSLGRAASGSDLAAIVACCIAVVALRSALRLMTAVRRTLFGTPF